MMLVVNRWLDVRFLRPCRSQVWRGCLRGRRVTVVRIGDIDDVEVGVVDGSADTLETHLVALCWIGQSLVAQRGLRDIEERIHQ